MNRRSIGRAGQQSQYTRESLSNPRESIQLPLLNQGPSCYHYAYVISCHQIKLPERYSCELRDRSPLRPEICFPDPQTKTSISHGCSHHSNRASNVRSKKNNPTCADSTHRPSSTLSSPSLTTTKKNFTASGSKQDENVYKTGRGR